MAGEPAPPFIVDFEDAAGCYSKVSNELEQAVGTASKQFHLLTVALIDQSGWPTARTVVLRGFDAVNRVVRFHTDLRSPKVGCLQADPRLELHFYDRSTRLQLRLPAEATIHHQDETARAAWLASATSSRCCYAAEHGPSSKIGPEVEAAYPESPAVDDPFAYGNFVVVACHFNEMELLELRSSGHRRVRLSWQDGSLSSQRLAP